MTSAWPKWLRHGVQLQPGLSRRALSVLHSFDLCSSAGRRQPRRRNGRPRMEPTTCRSMFGVTTAFSNAGTRLDLSPVVRRAPSPCLRRCDRNERCLEPAACWRATASSTASATVESARAAGRAFRVEPSTGERRHDPAITASQDERPRSVRAHRGTRQSAVRVDAVRRRRTIAGSCTACRSDGAFDTLHSFERRSVVVGSRHCLAYLRRHPCARPTTFLTHASDRWLYGTRCDGSRRSGQGSLFRLDPGLERPREPRATSCSTPPTPARSATSSPRVPHGPLLESDSRAWAPSWGTAMAVDPARRRRRLPLRRPAPRPSRCGCPGTVLSTSRYTEPVGRARRAPGRHDLRRLHPVGPQLRLHRGRGGPFAGRRRSRERRRSTGEAGAPTVRPRAWWRVLRPGPRRSRCTARRREAGRAGWGTVYKVTVPPAGPSTLTILRSFGAAPDGQGPRAELVRGPVASTIGTTACGGQHGYGHRLRHGCRRAGGHDPPLRPRQRRQPRDAARRRHGRQPLRRDGERRTGWRGRALPPQSHARGRGRRAVRCGRGKHRDSRSERCGPAGRSALEYALDLDDDGAFDDATGTSAVFPARDGDGAYEVAVRVTDATGLTAVATTTVTVSNVAPSVSIVPATLVLLQPPRALLSPPRSPTPAPTPGPCTSTTATGRARPARPPASALSISSTRSPCPVRIQRRRHGHRRRRSVGPGRGARGRRLAHVQHHLVDRPRIRA